MYVTFRNTTLFWKKRWRDACKGVNYLFFLSWALEKCVCIKSLRSLQLLNMYLYNTSVAIGSCSQVKQSFFYVPLGPYGQ